MLSSKLPRTLRLDPSDTVVFEQAAEPGEWAVAGAFLFFDVDVAALAGKARAAFRAGFVGVRSLGFSTLAVVSEAGPADGEAAIEALAEHIHHRFGAPDRAAALGAAREEVAFAASLCEAHPVNTVLALRRSLVGGEIREQFRALRRREGGGDRLHAGARAFEFVETEDEPDERADLVGLLETRR